MSRIVQPPMPGPFVEALRAAGVRIKNYKTPAAFERDLKRFLKRNHVLHLSTCRNNTPRSTPLEYRLSGLCFYILSEGGVKFENLKSTRKVSFSIAEPYSSEQDYWSYKGLQAWGTARILSRKNNPKGFQEALKKMKVGKVLKNLGMKALPPRINYRIIAIEPDRIKYGNPREGVFRVNWYKR